MSFDARHAATTFVAAHARSSLIYELRGAMSLTLLYAPQMPYAAEMRLMLLPLLFARAADAHGERACRCCQRALFCAVEMLRQLIWHVAARSARYARIALCCASALFDVVAALHMLVVAR